MKKFKLPSKSKSSSRSGRAGSSSSSRTGSSGNSRTGRAGSSSSSRTGSSTRTRAKSDNKIVRAIDFISSRKFKIIALVVFVLFVVFCIALYDATHHERISVEGYQHNSQFDGWLVLEGVDVSYIQEDIDWKKVKNSGIDFAFVRAGYRGTEDGKLHTDDYFNQNIKRSIKNGLMTGVYFFSQATTRKEAIAEANYVLELVEGYDITLPIVMDYEESSGGRLSSAIESGKLTSKKMTNICKAFTSVIESAGYESAVYGNYNMLTYVMNGKSLSETTNIWTAQYNSTADFAGEYRFWQCTDSMTVPGINGNVDLDFMYIDPDDVWLTSSNGYDRTSIYDLTIKVKGGKHRYFGSPVEPRVKVKKGIFSLREGRDYTVSYVQNTAPGDGYVIITGKGKYKDTIAVKFEIDEVL